MTKVGGSALPLHACRPSAPARPAPAGTPRNAPFGGGGRSERVPRWEDKDEFARDCSGLGGDLYDRGRRANVPAPEHSALDRSVSLLLQGDRVVVHTFAGEDWRRACSIRCASAVDRHRQHACRWAGRGRYQTTGPRGRVIARAASRSRAEHLGLRTESTLARSLAARHCRLRGLKGDLPGPEALRFTSDAPVSAYRRGGPTRPALLAGIQDSGGRWCAVEITYLAPSGRRALELRLPRKTIGVPAAGCAVRAGCKAEGMLVGEGVFRTRARQNRHRTESQPLWLGAVESPGLGVGDSFFAGRCLA